MRIDRNGTARPVGSCKWVEVDVLEAMALHDILSVSFLGEMTRESAVLVRGPLEVGSQEPVDGAHEFDLEIKSEFDVDVPLGTQKITTQSALLPPLIYLNTPMGNCILVTVKLPHVREKLLVVVN